MLYFSVFTKLLLWPTMFKFYQRDFIFWETLCLHGYFRKYFLKWKSTLFSWLAVVSCQSNFIFSWDWMPNIHLKGALSENLLTSPSSIRIKCLRVLALYLSNFFQMDNSIDNWSLKLFLSKYAIIASILRFFLFY